MKHPLLLLFITVVSFQLSEAQTRTPSGNKSSSTTSKSSSASKSNSSSAKKKPVKNSATYFDLNLRMGIPMNEFGDATDALPFGMNGTLLWQPTLDIPIAVGFDLGYMNYGIVTQEEILTVDITANGQLIDQFYIPLDIRTSNNIFDGHVVLRCIAPTDYFKPYIEGLFGFHHFWTGTTIYDNSPEHYMSTPEDNVVSASTQLSDGGLSYGGGVGMIVEFNDHVGLNLRANYLFGSRLDWFDRDDTQTWEITIDAGSAITDPDEVANKGVIVDALAHRTTTDMITAQLGVVFTF